MSIPSVGINRGYLFGIGKKPHQNHVYVIDPSYRADPFKNPNLCDIFDTSDVIVSDFEENAPNLEELVELMCSLPERLRNSVSPSDLQKIRQTLEPFLRRDISCVKKFEAYEQMKARIAQSGDDAAVVIVLSCLALLDSIVTDNQKIQELSSEKILPKTTAQQKCQERAALKSKRVVPLPIQTCDEKIPEMLSLLFEEPELLRALLFSITDPELRILEHFYTNAFERGDYQDDPIPDLSVDKLAMALYDSAGIDIGKLLRSDVIKKILTLLSEPTISEKIARFVQNNRRHLFFISHQTFDNWPKHTFPLTQIKVPLKPIGFVWMIRDDDGHEGVLMGSMHMTAKKLVDFPHRIMQLFDSSDAIAVEIDITREDVIKRSREEEEESQAKEIQLLSSAEKQELFNLMKSQYPDLEVSPSDKFDPQTQFLIQAIKQHLLQGVKKELSDPKDRTTNQSFIETGIEKVLTQRAKEKLIPIKDLEAFEDYGPPALFILSHEEMKDIIKMSKQPLEIDAGHSNVPKTLREFYEMLQKHPLQKLTDVMESGDLDALEASYLVTEGDPLERDQLIKRNQNMAKQIDQFMKSGQTHFCIAGAMHMAGPSSIRTFLEQDGYKLERIIVEEPLTPIKNDEEEKSSVS